MFVKCKHKDVALWILYTIIMNDVFKDTPSFRNWPIRKDCVRKERQKHFLQIPSGTQETCFMQAPDATRATDVGVSHSQEQRRLEER